MTSSNGNIFRVTGPLCGEFIGPGEFPTQRPVTRSFDVFFDRRLNKRLSKQPRGWWLETLSCSLWRQSNVTVVYHLSSDTLLPKLIMTYWLVQERRNSSALAMEYVFHALSHRIGPWITYFSMKFYSSSNRIFTNNAIGKCRRQNVGYFCSGLHELMHSSDWSPPEDGWLSSAVSLIGVSCTWSWRNSSLSHIMSRPIIVCDTIHNGLTIVVFETFPDSYWQFELFYFVLRPRT